MRGQLHGQPGFDGARSQAALLSGRAVYFDRLRTAGCAGVLSRRRARSLPRTHKRRECVEHPAERESADLDGEAAGHGGGALAGGDQSLPAVGRGPVAAGGCTGGWAESAGTWTGDSRGDSTACGTDRDGEKLAV